MHMKVTVASSVHVTSEPTAAMLDAGELLDGEGHSCTLARFDCSSLPLCWRVGCRLLDGERASEMSRRLSLLRRYPRFLIHKRLFQLLLVGK